MKKLLLLITICLFVLTSSAQTFSNSLVIVGPNDTSKYSIYISGMMLCKECNLEGKRWEYNSVFSNELNVKIVSGDLKWVGKIRLAPEKNDLQEPFTATYKIIRKGKRIQLKRVSMISKVR